MAVRESYLPASISMMLSQISIGSMGNLDGDTTAIVGWQLEVCEKRDYQKQDRGFSCFTLYLIIMLDSLLLPTRCVSASRALTFSHSPS